MHLRATTVARFAGNFERRHRYALAELHLMHFAFAPDLELQPVRQRVHHRNTDAVQTTGHFV
ncbi:MAG: hypothetical protein BWZ07_02333 [Alphaproteobacteria bacterium ADurb.BinA280]|nr:MAG: hypothetical protein BWZ07_02333 [Alphaproteobacteria bacterium ADurb.BinA280]